MEQVAGRRENVERIILYDGHIDFLMKDGIVKRHIRKYSGDGFNKTPFSRKILCGYCGSSIVRCGGSKRRKCWMCSIKKTDKAGCEHELMSDGNCMVQPNPSSARKKTWIWRFTYISRKPYLTMIELNFI